jgi:shikimate dehydrogenase
LRLTPPWPGSGTRPITATTRLAAVIGRPIRHSLSPAIMNAAFAATGADWVFLAFDVPEGQGAAAIAAARALGIEGLSVTMPHKAAVHGAVDECTPAAAELGAVNCVYRRGDRLIGDNTDGPGFVDALRLDEGIEPAGLRCVVVGAGGAGRAVARALGASGAAEVAVVNRSPAPAVRAAALAGERGRVGSSDDIAGADLVVNATPVGMAPAAGAPEGLPLDPGVLHAGQVVVDLIYHPSVTPLLAAARSRGAVAVNGLGMLVHQAAHNFRRWTAASPPLDAMAAAARAALDRAGCDDGD